MHIHQTSNVIIQNVAPIYDSQLFIFECFFMLKRRVFHSTFDRQILTWLCCTRNNTIIGEISAHTFIAVDNSEEKPPRAPCWTTNFCRYKSHPRNGNKNKSPVKLANLLRGLFPLTDVISCSSNFYSLLPFLKCILQAISARTPTAELC